MSSKPAAAAAAAPSDQSKAVAKPETRRVGRWYFGGIAAALAACCTHPLDLVKVHMQTISSAGESVSMSKTFVHVVKRDGFRALYNGISASVLRQLTYSTARFGIYESAKNVMLARGSGDMSIGVKIGVAGCAGLVGGYVGTPGDLINVRMQNDMKIPPEQRRNYKHALDGVIRVVREESVKGLFSGSAMASVRGGLMSIGQIATYDTIKETALRLGILGDNMGTHFVCSTLAGGFATAITMPLDVMKTKLMNAKPGEFKGIPDVFMHTLRVGPSAFYKGFVPAFMRLGPHTILTFVFLEQIKKYFGTTVAI